MWEFKAWSSASIRTLPAVAMAPLPPVHAPYSKMGRPSIQTTPQVGKKRRVDLTIICLLRLSHCPLRQELIKWVSELLPVYVYYGHN